MAVSLQKGQKISLSKEAGGELTQVKLGLGWTLLKTLKTKKVGSWANYSVVVAAATRLT